jgi:hypothetical protein
VALLDGDDAEVQAQFRLTDPIPNASPMAHGLVALNRCFVDLAARRPTEAEQHYQAGEMLTADMHLRGWDHRVRTLGALVAWSRGDVAQAEAMLRQVIADAPEGETAHAYLAQLLDAKGDASGAAIERAAAAANRRFEADFPAFPQSLFWVDPVHGGLRRRS